uniref:Uncharacterized protein n=1 Tax=Rhizophora mucronata TaxID=61149 RepID=A0A2P2Q5I4_RHIMU
MSPLSFPLRPIVDSPNAVTLEPLHVTPSQGAPAPHGPPDWSQLGGVFSHTSFRDCSAAASLGSVKQ